MNNFLQFLPVCIFSAPPDPRVFTFGIKNLMFATSAPTFYFSLLIPPSFTMLFMEVVNPESNFIKNVCFIVYRKSGPNKAKHKLRHTGVTTRSTFPELRRDLPPPRIQPVQYVT